jgi:oligosaccharyl transferase complex subunit OST4
MISDGDLYRLAIFLGTTAMVLIVAYHFLEVNAANLPAAGRKVEGSEAS